MKPIHKVAATVFAACCCVTTAIIFKAMEGVGPDLDRPVIRVEATSFNFENDLAEVAKQHQYNADLAR